MMTIGKILFIVFLFVGCRVQSPKSKGFILTPSGMVHKNMLTKKEIKKYKDWNKQERQKLK